jgi:hypothetical protein
MKKITPRNVFVTLNSDINMLEDEEEEMKKKTICILFPKSTNFPNRNYIFPNQPKSLKTREKSQR